MSKVIEIPKKIKIIFHWNGDKITRIFDLKSNKEINDYINKSDDKVLINVLTVVLNFIEKNFNILNNNIELPEIFHNLNILKFILIPVFVDSKKHSSLFLKIENSEVGIEIEAF